MVQETNHETTGQEPEEQHVETPESGQEPESGNSELDRLQAELKKVRSEAAKYRTERNETRNEAQSLQQQIQAINKALGLEGSEPDPDALQQELQRSQETARKHAIEAAAVRQVSKLDIRPDRVDAFLRFVEPDLHALEVGSDGKPESEKVQGILSSAIAQFPEWKRQATNIGGGANSVGTDTRTEVQQLQEQLTSARTRQERVSIQTKINRLLRGER
jgi:hypothetical protein